MRGQTDGEVLERGGRVCAAGHAVPARPPAAAPEEEPLVAALLGVEAKQVLALVRRGAGGHLVVRVAHQHLQAGRGWWLDGGRLRKQGSSSAIAWSGCTAAAAGKLWCSGGATVEQHAVQPSRGWTAAASPHMAGRPRHALRAASGSRTLLSVDLPEPFLPMMAWTSPSRTVRVTPFRICCPVVAILACPAG